MQGEVSVSQSSNGNFYLTANKASLPTSFNEKVCQALIGKTLSGSIQKVPCEEYEFTRETGETVRLDYRYQYSPKEESASAMQRQNPMEVQQQNYMSFMPAVTGKVAAVA